MQQLEKKPVRKNLKSSAVKTALFLFLTCWTISVNALTFTVTLATDAHAVDPTVNANAVGGGITLRSALERIDFLGGSHTINFSAALNGVPIMVTLKMITFGSKPQNVTFTGNGTGNTIIRMSSVLAERDRIFLLNPTGLIDNVALSVSNARFEDAYVTNDGFGGGAFYVGGGDNNSYSFTNCIFDGNTAPSGPGGAINLDPSGDLTVTNCTFTNNTSIIGAGGAISSLLQNNFSFFSSAININNNSFSNNTADVPGATNSNGGAVHVSAQGPLAGQTFSVNIRENTFTNNTADGAGGAISANNSFNTPIASFKINYNRFIGNVAAGTPSTDAVHIAGSSGSADITNNWWGCNTGAAAAPCNRGAVISPGVGSVNNFTPHLQLKTTASPTPICPQATGPPTLGNESTVTTSFLSNSSNQVILASDIDPLTGTGFPTLAVTWINNSAGLGGLTLQETTIQTNGTATAKFTATNPGTATINTVVDNVPNNDPTAQATIVINTPASISVQPTNKAYCTGTNAVFTVTGAGTPTLAYQWYLGATLLVNGTNNGGGTYSGATTSTLTITGATAADIASNYHVHVSNTCADVNSNDVSLNIVPQPVAPTLNVKTPNVSTICTGTQVNITTNAGTGGLGCADDYQVSIDGGGFVPYTPGNSVGAAATSSIVIQGRRGNCTAGSGCTTTAYQTLASWTVVPQPTAPTLNVKTPNVALICAGAQVNATTNPGTGGTGCADDYILIIDGGASVPYTPGTNVGGAATTSIEIKGQRANCTANSGCNGTGYQTIALWNITSQPVGPTINVKTPNLASVCFGTPVSATFNAGTGGCTDDFQVSIDGGGFVAYTPGSNVGAAATTSIVIQGRRASCDPLSGCTPTSYVTLASWTVVPQPVGPTLLAKTPTNLTICSGTVVSATFNAGSGGTGCADDYILIVDGGGSVAYTPGSNVGGSATTSIVIQGRRANCTAGSGCTGTAYVTLASWTVVPQPVGPTLNVKTPNVASVCTGTQVSATFIAGTGGTGCADDFQVSIDGGGFVPYTPGTNVGAAATSSIVIQGRRANCSAGSGCNGTAYATLATWTVGSQPVGPTLLAKTPNVATVCTGTGVSATFNPGTGACTDDFQVSIDGGGFVPYTPGTTVGAAATTSIVIQGRRANCGVGSGCAPTSYVTLASWSVVPQPVGPTLNAKTPNVATVCVGTNVSATFNAGSGGTGCADDFRVIINGGGPAAYTPGNNITTASAGTVVIEGRRANCAASSGCNGTAYTQMASWTVVAQPVGPTLNVKTPNVSTICTGTNVSATFTAGSGGTGCADDYQVSIDGGGFVAYTPGTNVGAAATSSIVIQGRRANCAANSGCNGTAYTTLASWTVVAQPVGPTLLLKTPNSATSCFGVGASATFNAGSGGAGCTDDYQVSFDGGAFVPYTPGTTVGAAANSTIVIQGRRANCTASSGCNGTAYVTLASWNVVICCPTIPNLSTNPTPATCFGNNVTLTASGLTGMNGAPNYGIIFKYSNAALADPYTGGTVITTVPNGSLTGGGTVATANSNSLPVGNLFIYAIVTPTPVDPACRPSNLVNLTINPVPTITITAPNPSACIGGTLARVYYSGTTGGANQYSIDYNPAANVAGFVDVVNAALPASPISLIVPAVIAPGVYNATLTVRNSVTGCVSANYPITVTTANCTPGITDPCTCLNNATTLTDGQFGETVTVNGPAGQTWTVTAVTGLNSPASPAPPAAPIPITVGTTMTETVPGVSGVYNLPGRHVDAIGYSVTVNNGLGTSLTIGNNCQYPNPTITGLAASYCPSLTPITLTGTPGDANIASQSFTVNGNPATQFTPSTPGNYTITYTVDGGMAKAFGVNDPGCIQSVSQSVLVKPLVSGTISNSGGQTTCAGNAGLANVFLNGVPNFAGSFTITPINGIGVASTLNWGSAQVGGPQGILIPAANLPNTSSSSTTYRVAWGTLTDANSCLPLAGNLSGFEDIVVLPIPIISVTAAPVGDVCPGTGFSFTITSVNNVAGATFNSEVRDAFNNLLVSGTNHSLPITLGYVGPFCNLNNPLTFTYTPIGPGPNNCTGTPVVRIVNIQDLIAPALNAVLPGGPQGNVCMANAPAAPSTAAIQALYIDNCTSQANLVVAQVAGPGVTGTNCSWTATYNYTISDFCGNVTNAQVVYTGGDTQAPTWVSAPGSLNTTVEYCNNAALTAAQNMIPQASDNCNAALVPVKTAGVFAVGSCPTRGTITNTFIVGDGCNNTSVVFTQTITITDNTGPVIIGASNQILNVGGANCSANLPNYILSQPTIVATDCAAPGGLFPAPTAILYNNNNTGNNLMWQSPAPGTLIFGSGGQIVPVTITAMDACGNVSSTTINVTLLDQTNPTAVCRNLTNATPAQINSEILLGAGGTATIAPSQINNGSSDNCSPVTLSFQSAIPTNQLRQFTCADIPNGSQSADINVVLVVTDASNNQSTCTAIVRVRDNTPASVTCPATQTLTKNANCTSTLPNYVPQVTATDNCGVQSIVQSPAAGSIFGAAIVSQVITMTVTDVHTNVSTCTFTVNFIDNTPPIITCPANITTTTGAGNTDCAVVVTYAQPTATDNCQGPGFPSAVTTTLVSGPASGGQFFVGVTTVTYRATDAVGNSSTCSFTVTVSDNTVPIAVCGPNRNVNAGAGCVFTFNGGTTWDPAIFDNCLLANPPITFFGSGATTFGPVSTLVGRTFNLGVTTVTATVRDASNNVSAPCSFTVTVSDAALPLFTTCPSNYTVTTAAPNGLPGCRATVTIAQPTSTQNCTTTQSWFITGATPNSSGIGAFPATFPMNTGVTQVQFRLDDANGNSSTCTYFVTVNNVSAGAITGTATASQNAIITSTITFTGSGGTPNYCFTYDVSTNGGPVGATQTVCTTGGQSTVTVSQSNAVVGTFQYRLVSATDANGCVMAITPPNTATITVVSGAPDLTNSQFFTTTQIAAGGVIDEVIVIRNVGTAPTSGPISFTITNYSALTGLTITQTTAGTNVTIGIDTYTISAGWTFTPGTGTFTTNNVIPAGGANNVGIRITRGTNPNQGANGSVTQTTTIQAGTGGGETPSTNNSISNSILKN